jgi:pilus assembly protein CpaF
MAPGESVGPELVEEVRLRLARSPGPLTPHRVAEALRAAGALLGDSAVLSVYDQLRRDVVGAGPLESLLALPGVTDVLVNGADRVYVDRGEGLELSHLTFGDDGDVRRLAQRLAAAGGRRLDDAAPYCDLRLPDGTRLHAVLAPIAHPGTLISLRIPARRRLDLDDLVAAGAVSDPAAEVLRAMVASRTPFLVTGGTGSGKTTLLASLLSTAPPGERIVIVEDSAELRPAHPHVVSLEGRPANVEGAGAIRMVELLRQALRMRPDRIVVGEVRGSEVTELLAALNTGHEGCCGTVHANSPTDLPARIEAIALAAGLGRDAVHSQLAAGLGAVVHLVRGVDGRRRVDQIGVPVVDAGRTGDRVRVVPAMTDCAGAAVRGEGWHLLERWIST